MRSRKARVLDIRSVYKELTPFRALRTSNKIPLSVDLFSVLNALNSLKISYIQLTVLLMIYELNLSLVPVRPCSFYPLMIKSQISFLFKSLRAKGLLKSVPFDPMLTHTVKRASKCYEVTDKGKKLISSYSYLVKDTQKQAKNARLKFIDGN
jgi:L-cystine uptake protein TcyP (sodium:dicarboxylate symporter family)